MRIHFDHGVPHALRHHLPEHDMRTAKYMGWDKLNNGDLLLAAETEEFEAIVTTGRAQIRDQEISGSSMRVLGAILNLMKSDTPDSSEPRLQRQSCLTLHRPPPASPV